MSTSGSTKKPDVAPLNKQDLMPARELFYPNDPLVGSLLSVNPFALFGWLVLAAVVLIVFAKAVGILSIPQASGNVGFWFSYNWSIMYLFIVPLIFAIASSSTRSLPRRLKAVANPTGCIVPSNDDAKSDYSTDFREEFAKGSIAILVGAFVAAVVVDGLDSWALWSALVHKSSVSPDWSTAYALGVTNGWHPPSWGANVAFDIVAYLFQGAYVFMAFYWVAKCGFFFFTFAKMMVWTKKYKFIPMDSHPSLRMGLRPLSPFFNNFLVMITLFLGFILYHRFQLMQRDCHIAFPGFIAQVLHGMKDASFVLDFSQKVYGLECLDTGMTLLLIFLVIPIVVIASFPLGILRHYAAERRDEKLQELGAKLGEALAGDPNEEANAKLVKNLDDRIKRLQNACVWPNGDRAALYFLGTIVVLALGAWLPPLLVILGATGLGGILLREIREIAKLREG